ncbi:signal peptidase I [Bacillus sp. Bva_UNVM-123]|uniref:signal peptidase I n=1 Tax=Bacillus sp. Bva_UNVM-123 TaxID=2829798 RepID=UPI00391EF969
MTIKKVLSEVFSWSKALLFGLTISIIVSVFIIQPFTVSGSSMEPTLDGEDPYDKAKIGDKVIVYKGGDILGKEPKYNDIVIIDSRINNKRNIKDKIIESPIVNVIFGDSDIDQRLWIKRIIGEEGDILEYKDGKVYRNGEALIEDYIKDDMAFPFEKITVPKNHVFVMGDNRNGSRDSREIGAVPIDNIVGKVLFRIYPFDKIRKF